MAESGRREDEDDDGGDDGGDDGSDDGSEGGDDSPFEMVDFTAASPWERYSHASNTTQHSTGS